ncbi:patatin [Pandoraea terrae]|uniref:Patatin n=1 Tax=Pandoraea terrae TaxID=1537710 RepID=A0A5E4SZG2_9BURK|nr:patatin-like phospholipase family protein [Pandoraea terrae]VVD81200.1 patatin [Pandoraea terrae]
MGTNDITAFVFAGGGSLGAIEVGMLGELVAAGIKPDLIVGASAGAINGAYFAFSPHSDGAAALAAVWRGIRREHVMPWSWLSMLSALRGRRDHFVDGVALRKLLRTHFEDRRLEDAGVPIHIVATDMDSGNEVVMSDGLAVDAVMASTAIPGVFPPVMVAGRALIDGGVANNTPVSTAVRLGAKRVIVLPAGFACAARRAPRGPIEHAMHALSLLVARQLVIDLERWADQVHIAVVPPLCPLDVSPYDYRQCGTLIDRAAEATRAWLAAGGAAQRGIPGALRPHQH